MSNDEKSRQLGMPFGTASHRLKKKILFSLLQKYQEDMCFKCGNKIETEQELSVEHKTPWLYISNALFWDLNNIAFSHILCNKPDRRSGNSTEKRKVGPEGMSWCSRHKKFFPTAQFTKDSSRWNGLASYCKKCNHYWRKNTIGE